MKATQGNLPINTKYKIINVTALGDFEFTTCENCGKIIRNVATVEDLNGHRYDIGLDCAETLTTELGNYSLSELQLMEAKKEVNRIRRFIRLLKQSKTIIINEKGDTFWFYDKEVNSWNRAWRGRGLYSKYKPMIDKLNVKKIFENN